MSAEPTTRQMTLASSGYDVMRGFLTPAEVPTIRGHVEDALCAPHDPTCERPHNTLIPLRWNDPIVRLTVRSHTRRLAIATVADAHDLRWISGYVSIKDPHSAPLPWHQDWWCWDHPVSFRNPAPQVAVLCYLTDTTRTNGALRVFPGSHARSVPLHASMLAIDDEAQSHIAAGESEVHGEATLGLRAGDAAVVDYRLLHATHANTTDTRRDCVILNFTPSWSDLPADLRGHLISHPALPATSEAVPDEDRDLLPMYDGERADLTLNRIPPRAFRVSA